MTLMIAAPQSFIAKHKTVTVLFALWLGHFAVDSFTGIWPIYKTLAGLDLVKAGLIASIGGFVGNSLQIVFGYFGDKGWSRILLSLGVLAAGSIIFVPYIETTNYFLMGVLVMLTYLGSSAYHPSGTGTASTFTTVSIGKITALFLSGGFVGYAFSQLLFTKIYAETGGKTAIMFLLAVVVGGLLFLLSPPAAKQKTKHSGFWAATKGIRQPLTFLYIVMICASGVNMVLVFLLPDVLQAKQASTWMIYGGGHMLMVMGGCVGLLPAGHLADKYGPRQVMMVGLVALGILLPVVALFEGNNNITLAILLFLLGVSSSTCNVVGVTYGNRLMPKHTRTVSGLLMGSAWCVAGVSTFIGGWLADPKYGGSPESALIWFVFAVGCGFVFSFLLPRASTLQR
ncbi:MFS transporter [bacterium]|nr:MFS transporter [bacterium]